MKKPLLLVFLLGVYCTPAIAQTAQQQINAGYNEAKKLWNNDAEWRQKTTEDLKVMCARARARKANGEGGIGAYDDEQININIAMKRYRTAGILIFGNNLKKKACPDAFDAKWLK